MPAPASEPAATKRIIIIGAGYCGAAAASLLLRADAGIPLEVILLNRSGLLGRGMAYGTRSHEHLLNVPVGRMDALAGDEGGFLRYARGLDPTVGPASFVSRKWFGDYLESVLMESARAARNGSQLRSRVGDALDIEPREDGRKVLVRLQQGAPLEADRVILTLGNFAPADPIVPDDQRDFYASTRYVRDPWRPEALRVVKPAPPVLLVGAGLTMVDVLLDLRTHGLKGTIYVISRRGLSPLAHRALESSPVYDPGLPDRLLLRPSIRHWLRQLRNEARDAEAAGGNWRDVIGGLRSATPLLWQALPLAERRRFLRHLRPYWEIHRHRCAPALGATLRSELEAGTLRLIGGRLAGFTESHDAVAVDFRPRGRRHLERLSVGTVINCTGPESNTMTTPDPLIAALRGAGRIKPDPLGLGLEVSDRYTLASREARCPMPLFYAGPFLRATHWEATAVPELRTHVARLVDAVLRSF